MLDNYSQTPHVCFKVEFATAVSAGDELLRILESHLHARFESVRRIKWWFPIRWVFVFYVGQNKFTVLCDRSRFADNEWILLASPLDTRSLLDGLRRRKPVFSTTDLMLVFRQIHALLATVAGITRIRWYFKGFRGQSEVGVATPDELPWTQA